MKTHKIGADDRYNKVKKSTKFQGKADLFDRDILSSNFDVMLVNFKGNNPSIETCHPETLSIYFSSQSVPAGRTL